MSYSALILGESGSGKTCSLRNLDPAKCLLIQPLRKPLPFRNQGWREKTRDNPDGNIYVTSNPEFILTAMRRSRADIIIVDDWQYILANQFMARRQDGRTRN